VVVIFTDGIDEPPPDAAVSVDLKSALVNFPKKDALFYFVNLGSSDPGNTLANRMRDAGRGDDILEHPEGKDLEKVEQAIGQKVSTEPIGVKIVAFPLHQPLRTGKVVTASPFELVASSTAYVQIRLVSSNQRVAATLQHQRCTN
jgi:hypothetical protein